MRGQLSESNLSSLLTQEAIGNLLEAFTKLLPDVNLALLDKEGELVAAFPPGQQGLQLSSETDIAQDSRPLQLDGSTVGWLKAWGTGLAREDAETALSALKTALSNLMVSGSLRRLLAAETLERYREINLLYNIGESISASLNLEAMPGLVLKEARQIIEADVGLVVLLDDKGEIIERASSGPQTCQGALDAVLADVLSHQETPIQTEIFSGARVVADNGALSTVVMAPMSVRDRILGMVLLGRAQHREVFIAGDRKLLAALAGQTAVAVENARLFASVTRQRDAIAKMNVYMDNIFASLASGVITLDARGAITFLNQAAERILDITMDDAVGRSYQTVWPYLKRDFVPLIEAVKEAGEARVGYELQPRLPHRGVVSWRVHVSPLQATHEQPTGVTIVVDDLTEQKQLEAEVQQVRGTFERYVSPRVVEQLLSDPSRVQLGGARQEVTILFADIRGFTSFSERVEAEILFEILNRHLTLAAEAVLEQEGTLDKFIGDAVMAVFNAPLAQEKHILRAVRAAWRMKTDISNMHVRMEPGLQLSFGIGISTGPAVVGNVGSPMLQNYTAIGSTVNLASRLQTHAGPGQILLDGKAYAQIQDHVQANALGLTYFKGHSEPTRVFELTELLD